MTLKTTSTLFVLLLIFLDLSSAEKNLSDRGEQGQEQDDEGGKLALPRPEECQKSKGGFIYVLAFFIYLLNLFFCYPGIRHEKWNNTWYFFSWDYEPTKDLKVTWFQARNICRRHCMDTVSLGNVM